MGPPAWPIRRTWLAVAGVAFVVYALTAQRGVGWQDSGEFQGRAATGDTVGDLGLALAHPGYMIVAELAALARSAWVINLVSALGAAVALANLVGVARELGTTRRAAIAVATVVGITHTWWWLATIAEVYTLQIAVLTAELWALVRLLRAPTLGGVATLAALAGLDWLVHDLALLSLPAYAAVVIWLVVTRRLPARALAVAVAAYLAAASPMLALAGRELAGGASAGEVVRSLLFGKYASAVGNVGGLGKFWKINAGLTAVNLAGPIVVLAAIGWRRMRARTSRPIARALAGVALVHGLFYVRYPVPDQFTFILPSMCLLAVAAAVGLDSLGWSARRLAIGAGVAVAAQLSILALAPSAVRAVAPSLAVRERALPFRDDARYWLVPWKLDEDSAQRFSDAALAAAGPDGTILAGNTAGAPLEAAQALDGAAPGVRVQAERRLPADDVVASFTAGRLFAIAPDEDLLPRALHGHVQFVREGALYRVSAAPR